MERLFDGVHVGTTHAYTVESKYLWRCSSCARTYARHSKSIDPTRVVCGANACGGKLVQERPAPRASATPGASAARRPLGDAALPNHLAHAAAPPATPSGLDKFAAYRNAHIPKLKALHPTKTYRELVKLVSLQYASDKTKAAAAAAAAAANDEDAKHADTLVAGIASMQV